MNKFAKLNSALIHILLFMLATTATEKSMGAAVPEKIQIGSTKSRALWNKADVKGSDKAPAIILIPGSGPNGPEEMMPGKLTEEGKAHGLIPGVGHGFSPPRGPRHHPLADLTVGPINQLMLKELGDLAKSLHEKEATKR